MRRFLIYLLLFVFFKTVNAQISIRESIQEEPINHSTIPLYDSLTDFSKQENVMHYLQYVGQKLYLPPASKKFRFNAIEDTLIGGSPISSSGFFDDFQFKSLEPNYILPDSFTPFEDTPFYLECFGFSSQNKKPKENVDKALFEKCEKEYHASIKIKTDIYQPYCFTKNDYSKTRLIATKSNEMHNKYFTIIDIRDGNGNELKYCDERLNSLIVFLKREDNNDTLYFKKSFTAYYQTLRPFVLCGLYEKQKAVCKGKDFVACEELSNYIDINSGEILQIKIGSIWNCTDIAFIPTKSFRNMVPYYIMRNTKDNHEIIVEFGNIQENGFLSVDELKRLFTIKQTEEKEYLAKKKAEQEKYRAQCIRIYGTNIGNAICNGNVLIGMNRKMCLESWGRPLIILQTETGNTKIETWFYSWFEILHFRDGYLEMIQK